VAKSLTITFYVVIVLCLFYKGWQEYNQIALAPQKFARSLVLP
jgi:hypothetical protein